MLLLKEYGSNPIVDTIVAFLGKFRLSQFLLSGHKTISSRFLLFYLKFSPQFLLGMILNGSCYGIKLFRADPMSGEIFVLTQNSLRQSY